MALSQSIAMMMKFFHVTNKISVLGATKHSSKGQLLPGDISQRSTEWSFISWHLMRFFLYGLVNQFRMGSRQIQGKKMYVL